MKFVTVHSWKASLEDEKLLEMLDKANVERNESSRVREGLKLLAKTNGVVIDDSS